MTWNRVLLIILVIIGLSISASLSGLEKDLAVVQTKMGQLETQAVIKIEQRDPELIWCDDGEEIYTITAESGFGVYCR